MTPNLPLIPANYAEILWHWVKEFPGEQAVSIANGVGASYSTISHPLTRMVDLGQLERVRIQVPSREAGKKPVSPFHYWAVGSKFKPAIEAPKLTPAVVLSPNSVSIRDKLKKMIEDSKKPATRDPLDVIVGMELPEIEALRDALNELFA